MARGRRGGKASNKRQRTAKKVKASRAKKAQISKRATSNREDYRRNQYKGNADIRTGGSSTGREKGIMASQKANKIKGLEQSVGSLDRRIQTALDKGDTNTAKDLRSRLNKFTTNLGYARAAKSDGVQRDSSGRIVYTGSGNPVMNSRGRNIFDETKDQDFLDPTRKLQNRDRGSYNTMYPISGGLNAGLKYLSKDFSNRDIPYNLQDMPGVRYPSDMNYGANEEDPFFGGRSRDPNYRQDSFSAPLEEVTISDLVDDKSQPFTNDVVPYIHPAIDINTRNEVFAPDVDNLPANNFDSLDAQFQEESNNLNAINNGVDVNGNPIDPTELMKLIAAEDAKKKAFANERQNVFYNKNGINVGGEGNLLNAGKELYNLGGYLSGGQALNQYVLEPAADAIFGENQMVPIDQSEFNPENIDYSKITETLKGPGYNLKDDQIEKLLNYNPSLLDGSNINSSLTDFYSQ